MNEPRYAPFSTRFLAALVDIILLTAASWALQLAIFLVIHRATRNPLPFATAFDARVLQTSAGVIYTVLALIYFSIAHSRYEATLGKALFRLRVQSRENQVRISGKRALVRALGYFVSWISFCAGFLMAAFDSRKRSLHDRIAGTIVTRL